MGISTHRNRVVGSFHSSPPLSLSISRRLPGLTRPWAWYHLAGPSLTGCSVSYYTWGKKARQKTGGPACMLACIACIEDRDLQTQRGERGKVPTSAVTSGARTARVKKTSSKRAKMLPLCVVERRGIRMGTGLRACRPWSFPISGRTYVTVGCRVACSAPDETREKREMPLKIFVLLFSFEFLPPGAH